MAPQDFPDAASFRSKLESADWSKFPKLDSDQLMKLEHVISQDMTRLMACVPSVTLHDPRQKSVEEQIEHGDTPFGGEGTYSGLPRRP